jgi:hypothetical protein
VRDGWQHCCARGQTQEISAGKFHDVLPDHPQNEMKVALTATLIQVQ